MDAFGDDAVRTVTLKKGSQTGGTEAVYNMIFWAVVERPGLILFIYPDANSAADQNALRFLPAARATPPVAELLSPRAHDLKSRSIRFLSCSLFFRGSYSEHQLESLPAPYTFVDELDRCPPRTAHLAAQRGKTYTHGKTVFVGKPGMKGKGVDEQYDLSDRRVYRVPCPHCGAYHERKFEYIRWAGRDEHGAQRDDTRDVSADPDQVERTARLRCPSCRNLIGPEFNHWQLNLGRWTPDGQDVAPLRRRAAVQVRTLDDARRAWADAPGELTGTPRRRATHAGFHLPELLSGLLPNPYAPAARSFVERGGRVDPDFLADHLGEAWSPAGITIEIADLRGLAPRENDGGYRLGVVPEACRLLLSAVDVQEHRAFVEVRAFGPGGRDRWLVWHEEIPCPEHVGLVTLDQTLYRREFKTAAGRAVPIHVRAIDSGDRTDEVYAYVLSRPRIIAVKGVGLERGGRLPDYLHKWTRLEVYPDGTRMRGSVHLLRVNTHVWKSAVQRRLRLASRVDADDIHEHAAWSDAPGGPPAELLVGPSATLPAAAADAAGRARLREFGRWHFPFDVTDEYFRQLTAEECLRVVDKNRTKFVWRLREGRRDNHYFDCAVYIECLADALGVRALSEAPAAPTQPARGPDDPARNDGEDEPGRGRESLGQRLLARHRLERRR